MRMCLAGEGSPAANQLSGMHFLGLETPGDTYWRAPEHSTSCRRSGGWIHPPPTGHWGDTAPPGTRSRSRESRAWSSAGWGPPLQACSPPAMGAGARSLVSTHRVDLCEPGGWAQGRPGPGASEVSPVNQRNPARR